MYHNGMEETIKKLKDYPAFQEFVDYILQIIDKLDTVSGLENKTNEEAGEEAKIRAKTKERLFEILKPFIDFKEKKERSEEELKKASQRYGL